MNTHRRKGFQSFFVLLLASVFVTVIGTWYWILQIESSYLETWAKVNEAEARQKAVELSNRLKQGETKETVLQNLQFQLSSVPFDETNFTCMIDTDTIVLSHPNPQMVGMNLTEASVEMLEDGRKVSMREHLRAPIGPIIFQSSEQRPKQLVYQVAIPQTPWRISVHTNVSEILAHLKQIEKRVAFTGIPLMLVLSLFGGACVYFISRSYERRLEQINQDLDQKVDERTSELQATMIALEEAKERAESADQLKSEFLHMMNHEYRTPLNGILGLSESMRELVDPDLQPFCDSIYQSGRRLDEIIKRVLRFTELEAGKAKPTFEIYSLTSLATALSEKYQPLAEEKSLVWSFKSTLPEVEYNFDRNWLIEAISLLVENAIKFTPQGQVSVSLGLKEAPDADPHFLTAIVGDTGVGIPPEKQSEIFDLFRQADQSNTRAFEGIGIGLSMCQRLVRAMNGRLFFSSEEGQGSSFKMEVELERIPQPSW